MISIYKIKPKFQQLLLPVLSILYKMGITANMITWSAILLSAATGFILWMHPYGLSLILLPFVLLMRMALNALDGMMARIYKMQSKKGEILNELGDVISDLVLFIPLIKLFNLNEIICLIFLFLSVINEYTGILGKAISGERRYEGPMGKSDRAFLVGLVSILLYIDKNAVSFIPHSLIDYIFIVALLLLIISTATRINKTLKQN